MSDSSAIVFVDKPIDKLSDHFEKLADGRWSYKSSLSRCEYSDGLACILMPPPDDKQHGLGDCLLCANWNKRVGCVVAHNKDMELQEKLIGLRLLVEQAIAWIGAGRFDRAISMLDQYVKNNPSDPDGMRELARIYERPEYHGRDKRRAIVLYKRFIELARQSGKYTPYEIGRAEERATALLTMPPDSKTSILQPGEGIAFQCFYRGAFTCFGYGVAVSDRILMTRAGEVDPESGMLSADMGGAMGRATTIFRRFKSENAKRDEQVLVKKELQRLSDMTLPDLAKDPAVVMNVPCDQVTSAEMTLDQAVGIRVLSIKSAQQAHQLLFTEAAGFKAEQCHELLRRRLKHGSQ